MPDKTNKPQGGSAMAKGKAGAGQVIGLVVVAVILGAAYVALDFYSDGEKNKSITESRGTQLVQALSKFKLEANAYPDSLDKLQPKQLETLPRCPGGEPFAYQTAGGDYTLSCPNIAWKSKPYSFSSKTRTWQE
jgi:hypothetical protein